MLRRAKRSYFNSDAPNAPNKLSSDFPDYYNNLIWFRRISVNARMALVAISGFQIIFKTPTHRYICVNSY